MPQTTLLHEYLERQGGYALRQDEIMVLVLSFPLLRELRILN